MSLPLISLGLLGRTQAPSFPIIRSTNNDIPVTFDVTHDVALPSGAVEGDLVVVIYVARSVSAMSGIPTPSGWDSLALYDASGTGKARIIYRIADGPLTTVTVTSPGANSKITSNSYCFSRYSNVPQAAGFVTDTSNAPNPPDLVPTGWGANPRVMWLSGFFTSSGVVTVPSTSVDFTDIINSLYASAPAARLTSSRREYRGTSLDPSPWGLSGSAFWGSFTIAIRGT
jgi:hypothetical protein